MSVASAYIDGHRGSSLISGVVLCPVRIAEYVRSLVYERVSSSFAIPLLRHGSGRTMHRYSLLESVGKRAHRSATRFLSGVVRVHEFRSPEEEVVRLRVSHEALSCVAQNPATLHSRSRTPCESHPVAGLIPERGLSSHLTTLPRRTFLPSSSAVRKGPVCVPVARYAATAM